MLVEELQFVSIIVEQVAIQHIHALFFLCFQLLSLDNVTFWGKIHSYYKNVLKWLVMSSFVLFYIGLVLRFAVKDNEVDFTAARSDANVNGYPHRSFHFRIVMAIALEIFWLRSLAFIIVSSNLGPSLVAIARMVIIIDDECRKITDFSHPATRSAILHVYHCRGDGRLRCRFSFDVLLSTQGRIRAVQC